MSRSLFFVGILLGCHWGSLAPGAATALGARGHDRGPEPSLRTSPASSSSPPLAVPSDSVGLIDAPRAECRGHTRLAVSNGLGRWDGRISWRFGDELSPVEDLAGPALRRPRGRPCNAYAMRCVSGGALRAGGEPWAEVCVARWWRVLGRSVRCARWWRVPGRTVRCAMVESPGQKCALRAGGELRAALRYAPNGALGVAPAYRLVHCMLAKASWTAYSRICVIFRSPSISRQFGRWFHAVRVHAGIWRAASGHRDHQMDHDDGPPDSVSLKAIWRSHS